MTGSPCGCHPPLEVSRASRRTSGCLAQNFDVCAPVACLMRHIDWRRGGWGLLILLCGCPSHRTWNPSLRLGGKGSSRHAQSGSMFWTELTISPGSASSPMKVPFQGCPISDLAITGNCPVCKDTARNLAFGGDFDVAISLTLRVSFELDFFHNFHQFHSFRSSPETSWIFSTRWINRKCSTFS